MRRIAATLALFAAASLVFFGQGASGTGGDYEVRAIFDNGGFLVPGEAVRIAGANVGSVSSVDVTLEGERVHRDGNPDPGKAVAVLKIDDAGFQDFRQDASCLIRPQSLLGEKYVDCQPTQPRAPGSSPPPPLDEIPDGQPGAGQRFLPLENNGKEVDIDLVNNIMREPFAERFRLILNDLGAGLAARGEDLEAIIRRADPALRQTNRVLADLASQNHQLSRLAADSDTILGPFARERRAVSGFINNANTAAEATAERSQDLEAGFQRFPGALRELRLTMVKLRAFSDQATPVFAQLRAGAPAIARSTRALGPFASAAEPALTSLGTAAQQSRQPIINSDPILRKLRDLAKETAPGAKILARLLANLRETGFYKQITRFLYNTTGAVNGFDQFGHFLRASLSITGCTALLSIPLGGVCDAHFNTAAFTAEARKRSSQAQHREMSALAAKALAGPAAYRKYLSKLQAQAAAQASSGAGAQAGGSASGATGLPLDAQGDSAGGDTSSATSGSTDFRGARPPSIAAARTLLDTLIGRQKPSNTGGGQ
jgi:phospholipid/cholesterol/gamma-HCH transport system substrate-binding protein